MSKSAQVSHQAQQSRSEPVQLRVGRREKLRGALVLTAAAALLVGGAYYVVLSLAGPDGWLSHMASNASGQIEGRAQTLAAEMD